MDILKINDDDDDYLESVSKPNVQSIQYIGITFCFHFVRESNIQVKKNDSIS